MRRSPLHLALVLLISLAFAAGTLILIPLRTDMAGFLPAGHDSGTRFLMREVREGIASSFITVAIEGQSTAEPARISREMRATLSRNPRFSAVLNGSFTVDESESLNKLLLNYRYLLAPDPQTRIFTPEHLSQAFENTLDGLESAAEPLIRRFALRDPTGAFPSTLKQFQPEIQARLIDGVWFAPGRSSEDPRALLLLRTRANGMNFAEQKDMPKAIRQAFEATQPKEAHLLLSGPAVLAVRSANVMRGDIHLISLASVVIVASILFWRFRSFWVLAAIGAPFFISLTVAVIVVRLIFGSVHGISFGFGMTMLGVSLDYPVLLIGHRDHGEGPQATLRRIGPSLRLAALTASLGLSGMILCGLPGLAQLGVFAAVGLLTSAAVTLLLMPRLIVAADLAPTTSGPSPTLEKLEGFRRWRSLSLVPVLGAVGLLLIHPPKLVTDLTALGPVSPSDRALELELRRELGTPDSSKLFAVHAGSAEELLEREETLQPLFKELIERGALSGIQDAAQILPSTTLQRLRQNVLPASRDLRQSVAKAQEGLPFKPNSFEPFVTDLETARQLVPLTPPMLAGTPLNDALSPLLLERKDGWWGLILPKDVRDMSRIRDALTGQPDVLVMDLNEKLQELTAYHTRQTFLWSATGIAAAVLILLAVFRDLRRLTKVLVSVGTVLVILPTILVLRHEPLSLVHVVAIQFVAGVALDYALFFARPQLDRAERARTIRTLVTCNIMTVLTFGCLAFCHTRLLSEIGLTISIGAALSLGFCFIIAGQRRVDASIH